MPFQSHHLDRSKLQACNMTLKSGMAVYTFMALGLAVLLSPAAAQNCGCQAGFCCSKDGYCGTSPDYCGQGCQAGPCTTSGGGGGDVGSIVTDDFFKGIKSQSGSGCAGESFYTREAFLNAVASPVSSGFGSGSSDDAKREMAAFFAHVAHETGYLCFIEEKINPDNDYCDTNYPQWPCYPGAKYYGRGPLQLSYNYNYGEAGEKIGFDGLKSPERVAQDPVVAFKAALWFWMTNVHRVLPQGFGATTRAINGNQECDGKNTAWMNARVSLYQEYCRQLVVDAGGNLTC